MRKLFIIAFFLTTSIFSNAQSWTKISTNFDSLWSNSVKYFNKGDTIIYYGSTTGTGAMDAKRFYVSLDGGKTFNRDLTKLDAIGLFPIIGLPINNMIIGFQNTPNDGSYSFQSLNNWTSLVPTGTGIYGEVNSGTLLYNSGGGSTILRTMTTSGSNITTVASGAAGIDLISSYNKGTRLLLGGGTANIKYVDNGNFASIQTSTISPAISGSNFDVVRFFESGSSLFAVINNGFDKLYKSTDNGATWNLVTTTFNNGSSTTNLTSSFIIGTPNGNIFFLETSTGTSNNVFLSTDGGLTASKIPNGLPSNGLLITPTIGKLLTNGNKVWYQVCKANNVDFVRTDTAVAGLYLFNSSSSTSSIDDRAIENISIFPNPTSDRIQVNNGQKINRYEIINAVGQVIKMDKYHDQTIELNNIEKGLYWMILTTDDNQKISKKLIKE